MKKILFTFLAIMLCINSVPASIIAKETGEQYHIKLKLDESQEATEIYSFMSSAVQGNKYFINYNPNKSNNPFLNLNANVDSEGNATIQGVLKTNEETFPIVGEGKLDTVTLDDNTNVYLGTVVGTVTAKGKADVFIGFRLFLDPAMNKHVAITTIGEVNSETGTAFLAFGQQTDRYKIAIDRFNNLQETEANQEPPIDDSENLFETTAKSKAEEKADRLAQDKQKSQDGDFTTFATSNYEFEDATYSTSLQDKFGYSKNASNWVVGMHTHMRGPDLNGNGSGTGIVRVFSNTKAMADYVKSLSTDWAISPTAKVNWMELQFGLDEPEPNGGINIHNTGPADSKPVSTTYFKYLSKIPSVGTVVELVAQGYAAINNANPDVKSSDVRKDTSTSRVEVKKKTFNNINSTAPDNSSTCASCKPAESKQYGGVTASFDYFEYLDGYGFLFAKSRVFYYVESSSSYYSGVYASSIITDWIYQNFM
jgi:hypothetical protein